MKNSHVPPNSITIENPRNDLKKLLLGFRPVIHALHSHSSIIDLDQSTIRTLGIKVSTHPQTENFIDRYK